MHYMHSSVRSRYAALHAGYIYNRSIAGNSEQMRGADEPLISITETGRTLVITRGVEHLHPVRTQA